MVKAMIVTVGIGKEGKDIAKAICFSVKQQDPCYIVFVTSRISQEKTMPFIKKDKVMQSRDFEEILLDDENNVEQIEIECANFIQEVTNKGFLPEDIVIDFTSGTKAMSVGLVLAALNLQGITLSYIAGRRNSEGRVISGEETVRTQTPNRIFFNSLFKDSVYLFNKYQFNACLELIFKAKELLSDYEYLQKANTLENIALAYSSWEKFNHQKAFQILNEVTRSDDKKWLLNWNIKNLIERNKQILYKEIGGNYSDERVIDLLENACRRAEEGKYDDAVARLYRLLEYLAQYQLYTKYNKVETKSLDISKLPNKLQTKYQNLKNREGEIAISLFESYELLKDLNDELGIKFVNDYKRKEGKIKKLLSIRNNSILAHGFQPVGEAEFKILQKLLDDYIRLIIKDYDNLKKNVKFPKIKII